MLVGKENYLGDLISPPYIHAFVCVCFHKVKVTQNSLHKWWTQRLGSPGRWLALQITWFTQAQHLCTENWREPTLGLYGCWSVSTSTGDPVDTTKAEQRVLKMGWGWGWGAAELPSISNQGFLQLLLHHLLGSILPASLASPPSCPAGRGRPGCHSVALSGTPL